MSLAHNVQDGNRTQDVRMPQNVTFDTLLLTTTTLEGLARGGFYKPSPIQLHGIPMGKCGFDLLLEAKSGTGKTAVFSIIALEMLDLCKGLQVVILAPTREIAAQICDVIKLIGSSYEGLQIEVVMGGLPIQEDILKFKNNKVHIVVGSPGRLKHLIQDQHIDVSAVRLLVLDEADRLMEKSFQPDINYIFSLLPKQKQVIMSSATYPDTTRTFINQYVQNAQHICPDSDSILLGIQQKATLVKSSSNIVKQTKIRLEELLKILSSHPFKQCLIFCNYQARVSELHKLLKKAKWPAEQLYGKQEQTDRLDALKTLQEYKCRILISTDLAARGIDASNVDLVINFEPPYEWQTYLHRIGRAGRFGSYGKAITILTEGKEHIKFKEMLKLIKNAANVTNLWDDEKLNGDDDDSSLSSEPNTIKTIECHLTDKELAKVEEKVIEIINESNGTKLSKLESFSDLQNSFQSRKPECKDHESAEMTTIKTDINEESSESKPHILQSLSDIQSSFVSRTETSENEAAERTTMDIKINEESILSNPNTLETFSDLLTSFASRKTGTIENKPAERKTMENNINGEDKTKLMNDETLQIIIESLSKMIQSSKENTPSKIVTFETLECDLQNFQKAFKEKGNNIAQTKENSTPNIENSNHYPEEINFIPKVKDVEEKSNIISEANHNEYKANYFYKTPTNRKNTKTSDGGGLTQAFKSTEHNDEGQGEYDNEYYRNVTEALREAGLPTAFGETKFNTWNQNNQCNDHNSRAQHVNGNIPQKDRRSNKKTPTSVNLKGHKQSHYKKSNHHRFIKDRTTTSECDGSDTPYDNGYYSQPHSYSQQYRNDIRNLQISDDYENDKTDDSESPSDVSNRNYFEWYKQLKLVTKQIEYAVYIDELSKL